MSNEPEAPYGVQMKWGVKIPMRDGVHLDATLYLPKDLKTPRPAIFSLTPYVAQRYHDWAPSFAENGYGKVVS